MNNQLINNLTNNQFKTNQLTNKPVNQLTKIMQNKANFKNRQNDISAYHKSRYDIFNDFWRQKNKAKQSQFKPNFELKLGLFSRNKPNSKPISVNLGNFKSWNLYTYDLCTFISVASVPSVKI